MKPDEVETIKVEPKDSITEEVAKPDLKSPTDKKKLYMVLGVASVLIIVVAIALAMTNKQDDPGLSAQQAGLLNENETTFVLKDEVNKFVRDSGDAFNYIGEIRTDIEPQILIADPDNVDYIVRIGRSGFRYWIENANFQYNSGVDVVREPYNGDVVAESKSLAEYFETKLTELGFALSGSELIASSNNITAAQYRNDTHVCTVSYAGNYADIQCAEIAEIATKQAFMTPFYEAYGITTGLLNVEEDAIDSSVNGYEKVWGGIYGIETNNGVTTTTAGGFAIFYRPVGGEWISFAGGQAVLDCSKFNTDELHTVFHDMDCDLDGDIIKVTEL